MYRQRMAYLGHIFAREYRPAPAECGEMIPRPLVGRGAMFDRIALSLILAGQCWNVLLDDPALTSAMVFDYTSGCRACHGVMPGDMSRNSADRSTFQANPSRRQWPKGSLRMRERAKSAMSAALGRLLGWHSLR